MWSDKASHTSSSHGVGSATLVSAEVAFAREMRPAEVSTGQSISVNEPDQGETRE